MAGQRRWNAAKITKRPMPLKVMPMTDEQAIELQAVENLHREDLSPIDEAVKYQQLIECYGKRGILKTAAVDMVSEKLKVSVSGIHASLKLLKLPDEVQEAVREMRLPPSHADLLGKLEHDRDAQKLAARQILNPKRSDQSEEGVMSFREAKRLVDHELEKMKNRTAFNKLRDEFVRKGDLVLSAADNAKLFVHEGNPWHLTHNSGFVKPDEYCNEFNCDTWKKACGKNAPDPVLAQARDGAPVILWPLSYARSAAQRNRPRSETNQRSSRPESDVRAEREHKARAKFYEALMGVIAQKAEEMDGNSPQLWRLLFGFIVNRVGNDACRRVRKRRDLTHKKDDRDEVTIEASLKTATTKQLRGAVAELIAAWHAPSLHQSGWTNDAKEMAQALGITLPAWKVS